MDENPNDKPTPLPDPIGRSDLMDDEHRYAKYLPGNMVCSEEQICPECGEYRPDDARVESGMKCGICAYGSGERKEVDDE